MKQTQPIEAGSVESKLSTSNKFYGNSTRLYISSMVSIRCKLVVKSMLESLDIDYVKVEFGEIELSKPISSDKLERLKTCLLEAGLTLVDDHKSILVERIKAVVIEMVHYADEFPNVKHSVHISQKLKHNYTYLANIFSEIKGITLEHFIILHKVEKVKEMILYDKMILADIAYHLNYSSSAHLSNQFKQITGLTPTFFKKLKLKRQQPLEDI